MRKGFTSRRCSKCNGNVFVDQDYNTDTEEGYHGWYEWCLQCGYRRYLKPAIVPMEVSKAISATKELAVV